MKIRLMIIGAVFTLGLLIYPGLIPAQTLQLDYSTYLGGKQQENTEAVAVDITGCAYVVGSTYSADFPTENPYQSNHGGDDLNGFISKLSSSGSYLIYSTYIGGNKNDRVCDIYIDSSNAAYMTGSSSSLDFPTKNPYQSSLAGLGNAFILKLSYSGTTLVYSTYLGGYNGDSGYGICVDSSNCAYVVGSTNSKDFPTKNPYQSYFAGGWWSDAFVSKLSSSGTSLIYSTYLGTYDNDDDGYDIFVDSLEQAYITGATESSNFPVKSAYQSTLEGNYDAFVSKFSSSGSDLIFSTYLGGNNDDCRWGSGGISVDSLNQIYIGGITYSTDFPTKNAYQTSYGGGGDAFITKLSSTGTSLVYSTYLGGTGSDYLYGGIFVNTANQAYLAGRTYSVDFPTKNSYQATRSDDDAYISKLSSSGSALIYSTYFGGSYGDFGKDISVDSSDRVYLVGVTWSSHDSFPLKDAYQSTLSDWGEQTHWSDAFVSRLIFTEFTPVPTATPKPTSTPKRTPTPTPKPTTTIKPTATSTPITPIPTPGVTPTPICMNYGWFVINEVGWAGTEASPEDEWIEIYNADGVPAVGEYLFLYKDGGSTLIASLSADFTGYVILERDDDNTISDIAAAAFFTCTVADEGESLVLCFDPHGCITDAIDCSSGWFAGTSAGFYSMERVAPDVSGNNPANWENNNPTIAHSGRDANSSDINGTAGTLNSASYPYPTLTPPPPLTPTPVPPTPTLTPWIPQKTPTPTPHITPTPAPTCSVSCYYQVSGRVIDAGTAGGIPGASVWLEFSDHETSPPETSGPDGSYYIFTYIPHAPGTVLAWASHPEYLTGNTATSWACYTVIEGVYIELARAPTPTLTPWIPPPTLTPTPSGRCSWIHDYNGDGTSDIAIFRGSSGLWAVRGVTRVYFGGLADETVPGDYDGDGTTDIGIFRGSSGLWALRGVSRVYFGSSSDLPHPGDYNGDGTADVAIFRGASGLWSVRGVTRVYFGGATDEPVPGYYNGDGVKDIGIFRPTSGLWALRTISRIYFGGSTDEPVPGDYDGNGSWDIGIFRPASGLWAIRGVTRAYFGGATDRPVPADYDGLGDDDLGIYRGSSGLWAVRGVTRVYFGGSGDIPITR